MADLSYVYAIVTGVFIVYTGILFGSRAKRLQGEPKEERQGKMMKDPQFSIYSFDKISPII